MILYLMLGGIVVAVLGSLMFSSLTYSLRDFSRVRLGDYLEQRGDLRWLDPTVQYAGDLIFVTAIGRLFANILILIGVLSLLRPTTYSEPVQYLLAILITGIITLFCSVAVPHAIAKHAGESLIGFFMPVLHGMRLTLMPATKLMHLVDDLVRRVAGASIENETEQIEEEILSVVEEGEKEGVVDEQERAMIESVISFRATQVGQIMTARPEIIGLEAGATLLRVKQVIEQSGHSRIPIYEGTLDHIVGILYARDLLKYLGLQLPPDRFDLHGVIRPPFHVPETKPLRDLLKDFKLQKVHIAIVLDEYGGTAGLVTIEDLLEELVGEMSDEHEPLESAALKRIDDDTAEADARIYIDELNRLMSLNLPEDAGYDTLGGFISTTLGRIPQSGATLEHGGVKYTILDAEPQKVNRVKIEVMLQPGVAQAASL